MRNIFIVVLVSIISVSCSSDTGTVDGSTNDGQGGSLATFALKGDYLYVVDRSDLNVFNISVATDPVFVNKVPIGFEIETLFGHKEYLYIGSRDGMFVYSLSDPEFPEHLSNVQHFTACDPVVANDSMAFVTLHSNSWCGNNTNILEIYDVHEITNPILISRRNLLSPKGLGLYGNYLIVCDDEIKIFDVSDPEKSKLVNSINKQAFDVIIRDNNLIAIGENGLYQYSLKKTEKGIGYSALSEIEL